MDVNGYLGWNIVMVFVYMIYMIYGYDWLGMTQMTELQNNVWNTEHNQSVFFSAVWFLSFCSNGQGCVWFHWFKHWNISSSWIWLRGLRIEKIQTDVSSMVQRGYLQHHFMPPTKSSVHRKQPSMIQTKQLQ